MCVCVLEVSVCQYKCVCVIKSMCVLEEDMTDSKIGQRVERRIAALDL